MVNIRKKMMQIRKGEYSMQSKGARLLMIIGAVLLLVACFYAGSAIARGNGKDEQRVLESIFATLNEQYLTATVSTNAVGDRGAPQVNGVVSLIEQKQLQAHASVAAEIENAKVDVSLEARGSIAGGDLFVKMNGLGSIIEAALRTAPEAKLYGDQAVAKLQNKWLQAVRGGQKESGPMVCARQLVEGVKSNPQLRDQFASLYKKHRFIVVENTEKRQGATAYATRINGAVFTRFLKSLQESELYTRHEACASLAKPKAEGQQQAPSTKDSASDTILTFEIADNARLNSVTASIAQDGSAAAHITAQLSYDKVAAMPNPTADVIQYSDIISDVSQMVGVFRQAMAEQPHGFQ